jgi:hypothetical protein
MQCGCAGANRAQSDGQAYGLAGRNGKPGRRIVRRMTGTAYELWLRPADGARLPAAVEALRSHPDLAGGEARTPAGRVPCEVVVDAGGLTLALPVAALERVLPDIWYPIDGYEQNRAWREPLDVWLTKLADHVARAVPIRHGLIGPGVSATPYDGDVPEEREVSHLVPGRQGGAVRYPPTRWYTPW